MDPNIAGDSIKTYNVPHEMLTKIEGRDTIQGDLDMLKKMGP